jgi:hypothetical protein
VADAEELALQLAEAAAQDMLKSPCSPRLPCFNASDTPRV